MPKSKDYFRDNIRLLGPRAAILKPGEYNLYSGLLTLSGELEDTRKQLAELAGEVKALRQELAKR